MMSLMQLPLFTSLHWCSCHLSPARWLLHGWECGFVSLLPGWEDGYVVLLVGWRHWWWHCWRRYHDPPIHAMENLPSMVDEASIKILSEESPIVLWLSLPQRRFEYWIWHPEVSSHKILEFYLRRRQDQHTRFFWLVRCTYTFQEENLYWITPELQLHGYKKLLIQLYLSRS